MDAVLLARIQFGLNAGFHFIFPPLTLGLTLIIVIIEIFNVKNNDSLYEEISDFLIKMLALIFALGVATGIVLEFSFGTNWANYSKIVGDIFGAPLAAEGIFSFFLESIFLGVLLFGRKKVSKKFFLLSAILVCVASHLSGLWILIANSWMQTPVGYKMVAGKAVLTDFWAAVINHSTIHRFSHTIIGAWITGSLFLAGICSWYILKKKFIERAQFMLKISLMVFILSALLQFGTGHAHSVQVAKTQPVKMAAFEALWKTQKNAPLSIFGIPDVKNKKTHLEISIPSLLSYFIYFDSHKEVKGLDMFPEKDWPPIFLTFTSYHIMIALGSLFALIALITIIRYIIYREKSLKSKWYLRSLVLASPLPLIANEVGWIAAEVGRQPWAVYNVLRTKDAVSVSVPAWQILISLIFFTIIYILLGYMFIKLLIKIIKKGPIKQEEGHYK